MRQGTRAVLELCFWQLQVRISVKGAGQSNVSTGQGTQGMSVSQASAMSWSQAGAQHTLYCSPSCKFCADTGLHECQQAERFAFLANAVQRALVPKSLICCVCAGGCCVEDACLGGNADQQGSHDQGSMRAEQQLASRAEHIWYQSTVSLKGITQVSSQPMDVGGFM